MYVKGKGHNVNWIQKVSIYLSNYPNVEVVHW